MGVKTIRVDDAGDLDLTGGRARAITSTEARAQLVRSYLRTVRGEWFRALKSLGVPYWEDILVHAPNANLIESIFAQAILERPGIVGLSTLDLELLEQPARTLSVTFVATDEDGGTIDRSEVL